MLLVYPKPLFPNPLTSYNKTHHFKDWFLACVEDFESTLQCDLRPESHSPRDIFVEFVLGGTYLAVFWFFSCSELAAAVLNDLARNRAYDAAIGDAILQVAPCVLCHDIRNVKFCGCFPLFC